jgi:hypothetical protein
MNSSTVLIVAVLCLAIGYIAGLLVTSLLGSHSKQEKEIEKPEIAKTPPTLPATPNNSEVSSEKKAASDLNGQAPPFDQALIWRDRPGGPLQIDLDGKSYSKSGSLTPGQRQRLVAWITELQSWLGIPSLKPDIEAPKRGTGPLNIPADLKAAEILFDPNAKPVLPPVHKSIVAQIDDVLQEQVSGTALAGRGIRLTEAPGQGVTVWIGLDHFQGIDAVTDAEVLAAIRHAVKTWEAKAG